MSTRSAAAAAGGFALVATLSLVWFGVPATSPTPAGVTAGDTERDPSPAVDATLSQQTVERFRGFRAGLSGERMTLRGSELTALLKFAAPGLVPAGVLDPRVSVVDGRVVVDARVVTAALPGSSRLSRLVEELADTVDVHVVGSLVQSPSGDLVYHVEEARAGRVPLPAHTVQGVLEAMSSEAPKGALTVPWPADVGDVSVLADRIVIRRFERIVDREVDGIDDF